MFFAKDSIDERHKKIRFFLSGQPAIAIILAAADFEWCLNRFIVALSDMPNIDVRNKILSYIKKDGTRGYTSGLDKYSLAWKKANSSKNIPSLYNIISNPDRKTLESALQLRHELIHGRRGTTSETYATKRVDIILSASKALNKYAEENKKRIYGGKLSVKKARTSWTFSIPS